MSHTRILDDVLDCTPVTMQPAAPRALREHRVLIPREALVALVLGSPLIAVTLSGHVVYGTWSERAHIVGGIAAFTLTVVAMLHAVFEGVLSRLSVVRRRRPARILAYVVAVLLVVVVVTLALTPVFTWMGSAELARHMVQAAIILLTYLAAVMMFKRMSERLAEERNRALAEREAALHARFQTLQARTNPHFLFNSLNSVMSLIGTDPRLAEQQLARLATLLRYSIEGSEQRYVTLRSELRSVRDYLAIEQVRFGDRLATEIRIDDELDLDTRILPMVLQPLVENAVLHGISPSVAGGRIHVMVSRTGDPRGATRLELTVDNDGEPARPSPHVGTRTSLSNLEERLRLVYGNHAALTTGPRVDGGFRARIVVPLRQPGGGAP